MHLFRRLLKLHMARNMLWVTTPTSMVNRLTGVETWTDPISLPAGSTIGGGFVGTNAPVVVAAATTTLTMTQALHAGKLILLQSTGGLAITPPAATGTGSLYTLMVGTTISGGNLVIDAKAGNASDVLAGSCAMILSGGTTVSGFPTAANSNLITMSGSTTGGVAGTIIEMYDLALHTWIVNIQALQTGSAATPFSNH